MIKRWWRYLKTADFIIIGLVCFAIVVCFYKNQNKKITANARVVCTVAGTVERRVPITKDQIFALSCGMKIEIKDKKVHVLESDCPNQICVQHGYVRSSHDVIVCVPNKCMIYIEQSTISKNDLDFISE